MTSFLIRLGLILINVIFWLFFITSSTLFVVIAFLIWASTYFIDPNLRLLHQFSCFWAILYVWVNPFWSLKISGVENADRKKAYVIVANHQSWVDILVTYGTFLHFKWVSKAEMFKVPLLGWNMWLNGYVPIRRGDKDSGEKMMNHCRDWLRKGSSVVIFPEGHRSKDGKMLPFKTGAFRLAIELGCDVLPIIIHGSGTALPKDSILLHQQSPMTLKVLPPISIKSFPNTQEGMEALMKQTRTVMEDFLEKPTSC